MINSGKIRNLYLAMHKVDFRRQEQGLLAEAYALGLDPFEGDLLLFIGRGKRKIKVLYADSTGLWLSKKAFSKEAMKTRFRFLHDPSVHSISAGDLAMLLEGAAYEKYRQVSPWPEVT